MANIDYNKSKLKILLVSDMYYPLPGGIPEHIHHLYLEMKKMGHTVHILTGKTFRDRTETSSDIIRYGYSISVPANNSFSQISVGISLFSQVKDLLSKEKYDIVHIHGSLAPTLPILTLLCSESTNIVTFHAAHNRSIGYSALKSPLSNVFRRIDGLIAVSKEAERSVSMYFPGDYRIIPNGVNISRFNPNSQRLGKYDDDRKNILFVGRHDPRKGIKFLYKAMDHIIEEMPEARLIVVGKGLLKRYYRMSISERVREHIIIEDYVDYDLLPSYYSTADVFVSPATGGESFGIVLIEAMASGVPVVASRIRGYRQVAKHRYNAYLVKPKDTRELAEGIMEVLRNEKLRKDMVANGFESVKQYSWNVVTKQVIDYYREIMKRKASKA